MSVPNDKLRAALGMLKLRELRDLGYERDIDISSNRKDDWVDEFLRLDWSKEQFSELIDWIVVLEQEEKSRGKYLVDIVGIESLVDDDPVEEIREKFSEMEVEFSENGSEVVSEGFEIEDNSSVELGGTYWSKTDDYILDPLGELRETSRIYGTGFGVDPDKEQFYISASLPAKAEGLLNIVERTGLSLSPVGYQDLANDEANRKMERFVEDFEIKLQENDSQERFGDFVSILQIKQVKIEVDEQSIKRIDFNGRRNIFDHPDVRMFVEDRDGRVSQIEGTMKYNGQDFFFKTGYTPKFGTYTIEKKGQRSGNLAIVEEAENFLEELYQDHFAHMD
ncbi:hypothetical protein [Halorubrum trueperi]|uniref:Uncharacterized protein n=1 Tax=Halorubrum trueperi TaxID=2004704 RepID=A0ABD5UJA6_9EURY